MARNAFRYFNSLPAVICLAVTRYIGQSRALLAYIRARRAKFVALITEVRIIESNDWSRGVPETAGQMS